MKIKFIFFILALLLLVPQLVIAPTQTFTYDNPTNQVNMTYDPLNRISTKNSSSVNITYAYDEQYLGTLSNITFDNSTYKYEYDDRLRLTHEIKIIDGIQFEKRNYYDSMGRLVKQLLTPGEDSDYYYNQQGKINKISNYINNSFHNAFDNPLNRTYANSKITQFIYDSQNGRLTQIKTGNIQQLDYSYDSVGNILMTNDSLNNRIQRMTYDFLDRLVNASINGFDYVYSYNPTGNILKIVKDNTNTTKFVYKDTLVHAPYQIVTGEAGIDVHKESQLYSTGKNRTFEFYLTNEKNTTLTNINWTVDFGNNNLINSTTSFNISTNESILTIVGNNYTNSGSYNVNFTGRSANASTDFESLGIKFGVKVLSLSVKSQNVTKITFELIIYNDMNSTSQSISWNCSTGNSSTSPFTLSAYENKTENFTYNYNSSGVKTLTCSVNSTDGNDSKIISFEIKGIKIEDYNNTKVDENNRLVQFNIKNYFYPSQVTWKISSDGQEFSNTTETLGTGDSVAVSRNITYTTDGSKIITINISSGNMYDLYNDSFTLKAIRIEDYDRYNSIGTTEILTFNIKNYWSQNMSILWNVSNPNISSNIAVNLSQGESALVLIENNYTTQGKKEPTINAYDNSFIDSCIDRFFVKMVEIVKFMVLSESQNSTIFEILAKNNIEPRNLSWLIDTGQNNISSSQPIELNTSEEVEIIVEYNYTNTGVYPATALVNSSQYNSSMAGVTIT